MNESRKGGSSMNRIFLLLAALLVLVAPVAAQSGTECAAPLIALGAHATLLSEVGTYIDAGMNNDQYGTLPEGDMIQVLPESTIHCIDGVNWYESSSMN